MLKRNVVELATVEIFPETFKTGLNISSFQSFLNKCQPPSLNSPPTQIIHIIVVLFYVIVCFSLIRTVSPLPSQSADSRGISTFGQNQLAAGVIAPSLSPLNLKLSKYLRNRRAGMDPSCLRGSYHHWVANPLTPPYQRAAGLITLLTTPSPSHIIRLLNPPFSHPLPPYQQDDASSSCPSGSTNHHGWTRADQVFGDGRGQISLLVKTRR